MNKQVCLVSFDAERWGWRRRRREEPLLQMKTMLKLMVSHHREADVFVLFSKEKFETSKNILIFGFIHRLTTGAWNPWKRV